MPIIEPECPIQQQYIEAKKAENRPRSGNQKKHAGHKAYSAEQNHQDDKSDASERAMRRQRR